MTNQEYIQRLRSAMIDRAYSEEQTSVCCGYASHLLTQGLPVLFDGQHVDSVLRLERIDLDAYHVFSLPQLGKARTITAPSLPLKQRQKWILREILSKLPSSEAAHGFESGRSIVTNAKLHANNPYVLCMDIQDFFPSISFPSIARIFQSIGYSPQAAYRLTQLCSYQDSLPQGAPTSPKLANLIFCPLDRQLSALARDAGCVYSRYADDLTFSGKHDLRGIYGAINQTLEKNNFYLNTRKIHSYGPGIPKRITGLVVQDGKIRVPKHFKRKLRQEIHYCLQFGVLTHLENTDSTHFIHYREYLYGKAYFIQMVEPEVGTFFLEQLDQIQWPANFLV